MKDDKPMGVEIVGGILIVVVFVTLAYVAISEKALTVGGKSGSHSFLGSRAVWQGVFLIGMALLVLAYLTRFAKYKVIYWSVLTLAWLGVVGWQWLVGF
jgi:hypothetical protein